MRMIGKIQPLQTLKQEAVTREEANELDFNVQISTSTHRNKYNNTLVPIGMPSAGKGPQPTLKQAQSIDAHYRQS